MSVEYWWNDSR